MNKVYNTVWNESTGMWVVTAELTRKGGATPSTNQTNCSGGVDCRCTFAVDAGTGNKL